MENNTHRVCSIPFGRETVSGADYLSAGLLVAYLLLGLSSFVWVFWSQRSKLRDPQKVSVFLISLVFIDVLNAISTIVMVIEVSATPCHSKICIYLVALWMGSRRCGVLLHLLVALQSVLSLSRTQWGARLHSVHWSVPITLAVAVLCMLFYNVMGVTVGLGVVVCVLALAIIASRTRVPAPHPVAIRQSKIVVTTAMLTFLVTYFPTFILECLILNSMLSEVPDFGYVTIYVSLLLKLNIRLKLDAFLCYFVLQAVPGEGQQPGLENPNFHPSANAIT